MKIYRFKLLRKLEDHALPVIHNQRGIALILALSMLAILSILGTIVLTTSNTEINISGNYKTSQQAFFAAERAVEYVMGSDSILKDVSNLSLYDTINLNTALDEDGTSHFSKITVNDTGLLATATNTVGNLGVGELSAELRKKWGENWAGYYYSVSVTGTGPNDRSVSRIDTEQVRLFEKPDSSHTTTGEGVN